MEEDGRLVGWQVGCAHIYIYKISEQPTFFFFFFKMTTPPLHYLCNHHNVYFRSHVIGDELTSLLSWLGGPLLNLLTEEVKGIDPTNKKLLSLELPREEDLEAIVPFIPKHTTHHLSQCTEGVGSNTFQDCCRGLTYFTFVMTWRSFAKSFWRKRVKGPNPTNKKLLVSLLITEGGGCGSHCDIHFINTCTVYHLSQCGEGIGSKAIHSNIELTLHPVSGKWC